MKNIKLTMAFLILGMTVYAQNENSIVFKDAKMNAAWQHYIQLKNDLIESNHSKSKTSALVLEKSLRNVKDAKESSVLAGKIGIASSLEDQRILFSELNNSMTSFIAKGSLSSGVIYKDFCPMANDNEGAYWFSSEKVITNPYFGDMMLRCGAVKETIQ